MSAAITALIRTVTPVAAEAIRARKGLDAVRRAFEKRYRAVAGHEPRPEVWERLEAHARVVAVWGQSRRKELADEYEQLVGAPPPTLMVEQLLAEVRRLREAA